MEKRKDLEINKLIARTTSMPNTSQKLIITYLSYHSYPYKKIIINKYIITSTSHPTIAVLE